MINFYEVLEVSQKASKEIIEKAYKVLAKRYHPDLQTEENKVQAKKKMQLINEAYETLSDTDKRKEYDEQLNQEILRIQQIQEQKKIEKINQQIYQQINEQQNQKIINEDENNYINNSVNNNEDYEKSRIEANRKIAKEVEKSYANAYNNYLRSLGYRVKERWTWSRFLNLLKVLAILLVIILALWFIPPTHDFLVNFYEGNIIIRTVVDIISNLIQALWSGICTFFGNLF